MPDPLITSIRNHLDRVVKHLEKGRTSRLTMTSPHLRTQAQFTRGSYVIAMTLLRGDGVKPVAEGEEDSDELD